MVLIHSLGACDCKVPSLMFGPQMALNSLPLGQTQNFPGLIYYQF